MCLQNRWKKYRDAIVQTVLLIHEQPRKMGGVQKFIEDLVEAAKSGSEDLVYNLSCSLVQGIADASRYADM